MLTDNDIKKLKAVFATKDDLKKFATKEDLKAFATKDDLKSELAKYATKDDIKNLEGEIKGLEIRIGKKLEKYATEKDIYNITDKIILELTDLVSDFYEKLQKEIKDITEEHYGYRIIIGDFEKRLQKLTKKVFSSP